MRKAGEIKVAIRKIIPASVPHIQRAAIRVLRVPKRGGMPTRQGFH